MNESKYLLVARRLREAIRNGDYLGGQKLPSENELVARTGFSRQTIRQAMALLETEGLTERIRGSGTYVKSIRTRKAPTHNIAVVTTYISEYIFPSILQGISQCLQQNGYTPLLSATQNRVDTERRVLLELMEKPIDGLIVEGTKTAIPNPNIDLYEQLERSGLPVVFVNGYYPDLRRPAFVVMDDRAGGRMAAESLLQKGHRHIAGFFKSDDIQGHRRYQGYAEALVHAGYSVEDDHVLWYTTENRDFLIRTSARSILQDCTAAVCYNDETAIMAIAACEGLPCDWVSFDFSAYARMPHAPFVSLVNPKEALGRQAAQMLLDMLSGQAGSSLVLPWDAPCGGL